MIGKASKILKAVAKNGQLSLLEVVNLCGNKHKSHVDQYPIALLIHGGYIGRSTTSTRSKSPDGAEEPEELRIAINFHMYTLPKNKRGEVEYMGAKLSNRLDLNNEFVYLKAKGALYLDEQKQIFWERVYSFAIGLIVGISVAAFSVWAKSQINMP